MHLILSVEICDISESIAILVLTKICFWEQPNFRLVAKLYTCTMKLMKVSLNPLQRNSCSNVYFSSHVSSSSMSSGVNSSKGIIVINYVSQLLPKIRRILKHQCEKNQRVFFNLYRQHRFPQGWAVIAITV